MKKTLLIVLAINITLVYYALVFLYYPLYRSTSNFCQSEVLNRQPEQGYEKDCQCRQGFFKLIAGTCSECRCNPIGSFNRSCQSSSGSCYCKEGYHGRFCDECDFDHYEASSLNGKFCKKCGCDLNLSEYDSINSRYRSKLEHCMRKELNSSSLCIDSFGRDTRVCHYHTGDCVCKPNVTGHRCTTCVTGYRISINAQSNEKTCKRCSDCVIDLLNRLDETKSNINYVSDKLDADELSAEAYKKLNVLDMNFDELLSSFSQLNESINNKMNLLGNDDLYIIETKAKEILSRYRTKCRYKTLQNGIYDLEKSMVTFEFDIKSKIDDELSDVTALKLLTQLSSREEVLNEDFKSNSKKIDTIKRNHDLIVDLIDDSRSDWDLVKSGYMIASMLVRIDKSNNSTKQDVFDVLRDTMTTRIFEFSDILDLQSQIKDIDLSTKIIQILNSTQPKVSEILYDAEKRINILHEHIIEAEGHLIKASNFMNEYHINSTQIKLKIDEIDLRVSRGSERLFPINENIDVLLGEKELKIIPFEYKTLVAFGSTMSDSIEKLTMIQRVIEYMNNFFKQQVQNDHKYSSIQETESLIIKLCQKVYQGVEEGINMLTRQRFAWERLDYLATRNSRNQNDINQIEKKLVKLEISKELESASLVTMDLKNDVEKLKQLKKSFSDSKKELDGT